MRRDVEKLLDNTLAKIDTGFTTGASLSTGILANGQQFDANDGGIVGLSVPCEGNKHVRLALVAGQDD